MDKAQKEKLIDDFATEKQEIEKLLSKISIYVSSAEKVNKGTPKQFWVKNVQQIKWDLFALVDELP